MKPRSGPVVRGQAGFGQVEVCALMKLKDAAL